MFKFILVVTAMFLLTGCTNDEPIQAEPTEVANQSLPVSTYFAMREGLDDQRWQNFIIISVNSDDIVTSISLNSISQLANNSRRNVAQLDGFEDLFEYDFHEQAYHLESTLVGTSRQELVAALLTSAASESVDFDIAEFAYLADIALAAAPIERGAYVDGIYRYINQIAGEQFNYFVYLFVINGRIQAVHFNAFNPDDTLKYDAFSGTTVDPELIAWRYQAELFEAFLLEAQDPLVITFCEDGYTTDIPGFHIKVTPFIQLATEALSQNPITNQ